MTASHRTLILFLGLAGALAILPGCVVWDINDGIVASNGNLGRIEGELQAINEELGQTNENLTTVEARLDSMDQQLKSLQDQLTATNKHLESLRKTINNIDSTIPFLKLSGDDKEAQMELENGETPPTQEPKSEEPAGE
ncbi:MAG: hypothetical protein KDA29_01770 [Phycisphaerales bacterium]|nr:hypothetical protein [Phycisphaerales bacterium]